MNRYKITPMSDKRKGHFIRADNWEFIDGHHAFSVNQEHVVTLNAAGVYSVENLGKVKEPNE